MIKNCPNSTQHGEKVQLASKNSDIVNPDVARGYIEIFCCKTTSALVLSAFNVYLYKRCILQCIRIELS
jgi:hypothetical protein